MKTLYNECVCCKAKWQVVGPQSHMDWEDITLDQIDLDNIKKHGRLYSICGDCSETGNCEPMEVK